MRFHWQLVWPKMCGRNPILISGGSFNLSSGFATDTKDQVKQANDLVDLVGSYYPLRRKGSGYVCHCPWHDDTNPSFQINPARQSWACYVCGIRGDVFDFVMRKEGVEFFEALKILAERVGIPITVSQKKVVKGSPQDKQTLYRAMNWAVERFHTNLLDSTDSKLARDYLNQRNFTPEAIQQFRIGFAPLKWNWLADQSASTEFSMEILAACDLVATSDRGSGYYERFRGRLLFPIFDAMGRPIAMGGRVIPELHPEGEVPPAKYVNSRETKLFSKSETLYGLNFVKDAVSKTRSLTIVEGYTDVIGAWEAGLRDVVACLGTAITEKHIRLIKRFADRITLVLDGDEAGQNTANKILDLFVAHDVDMRILTLPEGQDPLDFLRNNGAQPFEALVAGATDAIDHKIRVATKGIDLVRDTHQANMALEQILLTLSRIPASLFAKSPEKALRQDQLLNRLSRQFGVEREQLKQRIVELRTKNRSAMPVTETVNSPLAIDYTKLLRRECELVQLLLNAPEHLDTIVENIPPSLFVSGPLRRLYEIIDDCFQSGEEVSFDAMLLNIEDTEIKSLLIFLDEQWHEKLEALKPQPGFSTAKLVEQTMTVFRRLESESDSRKAIGELQNKQLDEQEELTTLEELLNQSRQQHGL